MPRGDHIEVPFTGGLDRSTAERHVESPRLLVAENVDYGEGGRVRKRVGYELIDSLAGSPLQFLHEREGALLAHAQSNNSIYDTVAKNFFGLGGNTLDYPVSSSVAVSGSGLTTFSDATAGNGYRVFAFLETQQLYTVRVDDSSGSTVSTVNPQSLSTAALAVRILVTGTTAVLVYIEGTDVKARSMDLTAGAPVWSSATTVRSDVHASDKYLDAAVFSATQFVFSYRTNSGSTIRTELVTTSTLTTAANRTDTFAGTLRSIGVYWSATADNGLTMIADSTNGVVGKHWDSGLAGTASSAVDAAVTDALNVTACDGTASDRIMVWYTENSASNLGHKVHYREVTADESSGAPVGSTVTKNSVALVAKPFTENSRQYCQAVWDNDDDEERMLFLLCNRSSFLYVTGRALYLTANGVLERSRLSSSASTQSSVYVCGAIVRTKIVGDATVHTGGETMLAGIIWDFRAAQRHMAINYGRTIFVPGSVPHGTDYLGSLRHGFLHSPEVSLSVTTGGSMTSNSTYTYAVVYQHIDDRGQVHWSVPSPLKTVSLGAGDNAVTVNIRINAQIDDAVALVFRSQANDATILNLTGTTSLAGLTTPTTTFTDTNADSAIDENEILYTNGGAQLGRHAAPPSRFATVHDQRIWVISDDDGSIWPSHRRVDPEAVGFHPSLAIDGSVAGRRPIAIASLSDSRLAVFWDNRIAIIHGTGPNAAGEGSTYTEPLPVPSPAFCDEPRSVLSTHLGVVFQSTTMGIWLLDQNAQLQHIGDPVGDYEVDTCVGAVQLIDQTEVAFVTLDGSDTRVLYWEYEQGKWSTQLIPSKTAVSATRYRGRLAILFGDGDIWHARSRSDGRFDFGGTAAVTGDHKAMQVDTAWIKARGKQGHAFLHRLFALLERKEAAGLRVELAYNYGTTYIERADYTDTELSGADPLHIEVQPKTARIEAFKLKLLEQLDGSNKDTEGFCIDSLRVELAREQAEFGGIHAALKKGAATI